LRRGLTSYSPEMLARFAITPGALAETAVPAPRLGTRHRCLNDLCRAEASSQTARGRLEPVSRADRLLAKRFLTFARKERRLIPVPPQLAPEPDNDEEWLWRHSIAPNVPCRALITDMALRPNTRRLSNHSIERLNMADCGGAITIEKRRPDHRRLPGGSGFSAAPRQFAHVYRSLY